VAAGKLTYVSKQDQANCDFLCGRTLAIPVAKGFPNAAAVIVGTVVWWSLPQCIFCLCPLQYKISIRVWANLEVASMLACRCGVTLLQLHRKKGCLATFGEFTLTATDPSKTEASSGHPSGVAGQANISFPRRVNPVFM
jgi:hypothetical protein